MTFARSINLSIFSMVLFCAKLASAQVPDASGNRLESFPTTGMAQSLDYSLRLHSNATVASPLIRLRDVAAPLGTPSAWWDRAGGVVIGMMPIDGGEMVIERDRLNIAIDQDASIPPIGWSGPSTVRVKLVPPKANPLAGSKLSPIVSNPVQQTDASTVRGDLSATSATAPMQAGVVDANDAFASNATVSAKVPVSDLPPLNSPDSDRIIRLIQFAIDRADLSLRDVYDIEIDPDQIALRTLAEIRRIDRIEFITRPTEGQVPATIFGMTTRNPISQTLEVRFITRPMVVVPRDNLRRGQVITAADLTLIPAPRGYPLESAITKIEDVVDMQVVNALPKDRPIASSSITRPVLIERGDLVEVHVVGGGVTVATSARSLSKGAAGDLIAVETLEPRKKIIARVARSGLVEVFTRPPRVR
jgi:flagella basal body P-ring formation protein FlgA